jgi:hypothetical protein
MADEPPTSQEIRDGRDRPPPIYFPPISAYLSPPSGLQRLLDCTARRIEDVLSWLSRQRRR